jgi:hypothetical protein
MPGIQKDPKRNFLSENLSRAKSRKDGKVFNITVDDLIAIGEKQKWRCALTRKPLEFTRGGEYFGGKWANPRSCSIDRIDSEKGYVKENIQLVLWAVNYMKSHLANDEFRMYAKLVK